MSECIRLTQYSHGAGCGCDKSPHVLDKKRINVFPQSSAFAEIEGEDGMTDVTGFGLFGHLSEVCQGSSLRAEVRFEQIPTLAGVDVFIAAGAVPNVTLPAATDALRCDAQTFGGLRVAFHPLAIEAHRHCAKSPPVHVSTMCNLLPADAQVPVITVVP